LKRDDGPPRQELAHDQAPEQQKKQVPPYEGSKFCRAHLEMDIHAVALTKKNVSGNFNANQEILSAALNTGRLREVVTSLGCLV
jgi:hypothetical protein